MFQVVANSNLEMCQVAASSNLGMCWASASLNLGMFSQQTERGSNELFTGTGDTPHENDLVSRLIRDDQDLWKEVLGNPFCVNMKTASADDRAVLEGFKWYMTQNYHYCVKLITYEEARALQTTNLEESNESVRRVQSKADYAKSILDTCTSRPPGGLGIEDSVVLGASEADALKSYADFQISTADPIDWVLSFVALVPCIQSYYQIAVDLKENSVNKDTVWYNLWVLGNAKYESSTIKQRRFFIRNSNRWKCQYETANAIFKRACQGKINMRAIALEPGGL